MIQPLQWKPDQLLIHDVYTHFGFKSITQAGVKSMSRHKGLLLIKRLDTTIIEYQEGDMIYYDPSIGFHKG